MACEAAERLLRHDDILTTLVIDPRMGFKRRKQSNYDLPLLHEDASSIIGILESVTKEKDIARARNELLSSKFGREVTDSMGDKSI